MTSALITLQIRLKRQLHSLWTVAPFLHCKFNIFRRGHVICWLHPAAWDSVLHVMWRPASQPANQRQPGAGERHMGPAETLESRETFPVFVSNDLIITILQFVSCRLNQCAQCERVLSRGVSRYINRDVSITKMKCMNERQNFIIWHLLYYSL